MKALLIVLDGVGVGGAPDAAQYRDEGADTLHHVLEAAPGLQLPALDSLGLGRILGRGHATPLASWGIMQEKSAGKDSTTGHWELAGVVLDEPFGTFSSFPPELVQAIEQEASVRFIGNRAASGTAILDELGPQHLQTGNLILYTSADSVLQIAAHEEILPVEQLYRVCQIARKHADQYRIGRVIARPFRGAPGGFTRTAARRDFSMRPPATVLDAISDHGFPVIGVGKTGELFASQGIDESFPTESNRHGMSQIERLWRGLDSGLIFANLVDFDTCYGHRRDVHGFATALQEFDQWLATFLPQVREEDLLVITADHGNDPTYPGTDHTRERVPLIVRHGHTPEDLGLRHSFADVATSLATFFSLPPWPTGNPFLSAAPGDAAAFAGLRPRRREVPIR